jgi:restriction endonuclease Mrr
MSVPDYQTLMQPLLEMIDHGIGTTISRSYEIRRIDSDYLFEDGSE